MKQVGPVKNQFVSTLFLVEKDKTVDEYRPIINVRPLDRFVDCPFRIEGVPVVSSLIQLNDYMMKRCVLLRSDPPRPQEVPAVSLRWHDIRVPAPPIWAEIITVDVFRNMVTLLQQKCPTAPSQQIIFLGTLLDSVAMTLSLPEDRLRLEKNQRYGSATTSPSGGPRVVDNSRASADQRPATETSPVRSQLLENMVWKLN